MMDLLVKGFLLCIACSLPYGAVYGADASCSLNIDSTVYYYSVDEEGFAGQCQVSLKALQDSDELGLITDQKADLLTEGLRLTPSGDGYVIKGLDLKAGGTRKVLIKFSGPVTNHSIEFLPFRFQCDVANTLVAVECPRNKFAWDIGFPVHSLYETNAALIQDTVSSDEVASLDSSLRELRNSSGSAVLPENRLYLGRIDLNEKTVVRGSVFEGHDYYLPQVLLVVFICIVLYAAHYFLTKKIGIDSGGESHESCADEEADEAVSWEARKAACEEILQRLAGDEYAVYKTLFDSHGMFLQRDLPEKTGFSKAKVTRILDRLEQKGLVERKSYGVTNKVVLR